jgi:hypothetical protein
MHAFVHFFHSFIHLFIHRTNQEVLVEISNLSNRLFNSEQLMKLIDVTTSIKTKIEIIHLIASSNCLTDPKAKFHEFLNLFRFHEDKEKVSDILITATRKKTGVHYTRRNSITNSKSGILSRSKKSPAVPVALATSMNSLPIAHENDTNELKHSEDPRNSNHSKYMQSSSQLNHIVEGRNDADANDDRESVMSNRGGELLIINHNADVKTTKMKFNLGSREHSWRDRPSMGSSSETLGVFLSRKEIVFFL